MGSVLTKSKNKKYNKKLNTLFKNNDIIRINKLFKGIKFKEEWKKVLIVEYILNQLSSHDFYSYYILLSEDLRNYFVRSVDLVKLINSCALYDPRSNEYISVKQLHFVFNDIEIGHLKQIVTYNNVFSTKKHIELGFYILNAKQKLDDTVIMEMLIMSLNEYVTFEYPLFFYNELDKTDFPNEWIVGILLNMKLGNMESAKEFVNETKMQLNSEIIDSILLKLVNKNEIIKLKYFKLLFPHDFEYMICRLMKHLINGTWVLSKYMTLQNLELESTLCKNLIQNYKTKHTSIALLSLVEYYNSKFGLLYVICFKCEMFCELNTECKNDFIINHDIKKVYEPIKNKKFTLRINFKYYDIPVYTTQYKCILCNMFFTKREYYHYKKNQYINNELQCHKIYKLHKGVFSL